jgi:hypothetical protein
MFRQTLTTPDGPERHRRFYLAVLIDRGLRPVDHDDKHSRSVMSGIVNGGRESGRGNIDANDPRQTSDHNSIDIFR